MIEQQIPKGNTKVDGCHFYMHITLISITREDKHGLTKTLRETEETLIKVISSPFHVK